MVGGEDPIIEGSLGEAGTAARWAAGRARAPVPTRSLLKQRGRRAIQEFLGPELLQFFLNPFARVLAMKFRGAKFASGKIQGRESYPIPDLRHRCQKVVLLRTQRRIRSRAGRDYSRDLAANEFLGQTGILHLLADGDLESFADELGNVAFRRVIRYATHGDGHAFFLITRGQRNLQLA